MGNITLRISGGQEIGNFIDTNEKVVGFNPLSKKVDIPGFSPL